MLAYDIERTRALIQDPVYRGLIDSIIEEPHDLSLRLIVADWLMQQDDELAQSRGRFIMGNVYACNPHLMPGRKCFETGHRVWKGLEVDPECSECQYRVWSQSWYEFDRAMWLAAENIHYDSATTAFTYQSGFLHKIECSMTRWEINGYEFVTNNPIQGVTLNNFVTNSFLPAYGCYSLCAEILSDKEKYEQDDNSLIVWASLFGRKSTSDNYKSMSKQVVAIKQEARRRGFSLYVERRAQQAAELFGAATGPATGAD